MKDTGLKQKNSQVQQKYHLPEKYLAIYFPEWSVDLARQRLKKEGLLKDAPIVLTSSRYKQNSNGGIFIKRFSRKLETHGIEEGSSLELAQAISSDLVVADFVPEDDFQILKRIAQWMIRFSPLVAIDEEAVRALKESSLFYLDQRYNGIVLNITGMEKLYSAPDKKSSSAKNLARLIYQALLSLNTQIRFGVGPTIGSAWALSRYSKNIFSEIYTNKEIREELSELPIESLRIKHNIVRSFKELGIFTIGHLLQLPRKEIAPRFGLAPIRRIDQFLGDIPELLSSVQVQQDLFLIRAFDTPLLNQKQITTALIALFQELIEEAIGSKRKASLFRFTLIGMDKRYESFLRKKQISLHQSTGDKKYLTAILTPIIENIKFPGTVSEIKLEICNQDELRAHQLSQEHTLLAPPAALDELINSLSLQLGQKALNILELKQSHIPEKAFSFSSLPPGELPQISKNSTLEQLPALHYPSVIFTLPQQIHALSLLPDYPPARITWNNQEYKILQSIGPERITDEWWARELGQTEKILEREYFRLQEHTGRWLWVYRKREDLSWFVHGVWA